MTLVKVQGKTYGLKYDLCTVEAIEKEFGSREKMKEAQKKMSSVDSLRLMFRLMVNSWLDTHKLPPLSADEVKARLQHATVGELDAVNKAIEQAMAEGMKVETIGGNEADDEVVDEWLQEIESKNVQTGGRRGRGNTTGTR